MAKPVERIFKMDYEDMMERARLFHDNFIDDKSDFTTLFPTLDDPFAADMETAIDTADAVPSGSQVDSEIAVVTEQLKEAMITGRKSLQVLYIYVNMRWSSKAKSNSFGKNKYNNMKQSQVNLPELMEEAHAVAIEPSNATALAEQGYTSAMAADLITKAESIVTLNRNQEKLKSARGYKTMERVEKYNDVWEYMRQINQASKVVYQDNSAKLEQYLLYPTVHHGLSKVQNFVGVLDVGPPQQVNLTWNSVVDATEYEIERSSVPLGQPLGSWQPLTIVELTSFADITQSVGSNYYRVRAKSELMIGSWSDVVQVDL